MDNIQFWIYVIVIVITLIARASKKKPGAPESGHTDHTPVEPNTKPISFEDLLREIQEAKTPQKYTPAPEPKTKPVLAEPSQKYEFEDYDDNLEEEVKSLEKPDYAYQDDKIYETYETAKQAAFARPSLEETLKVENTVVKFNQFKEYAREEKPSMAVRIRKELADRESFKKAFILSEILNRRY